MHCHRPEATAVIQREYGPHTIGGVMRRRKFLFDRICRQYVGQRIIDDLHEIDVVADVDVVIVDKPARQATGIVFSQQQGLTIRGPDRHVHSRVVVIFVRIVFSTSGGHLPQICTIHVDSFARAHAQLPYLQG